MRRMFGDVLGLIAYGMLWCLAVRGIWRTWKGGQRLKAILWAAFLVAAPIYFEQPNPPGLTDRQKAWVLIPKLVGIMFWLSGGILLFASPETVPSSNPWIDSAPNPKYRLLGVGMLLLSLALGYYGYSRDSMDGLFDFLLLAGCMYAAFVGSVWLMRGRPLFD